jgi:O-antigen/teichoic acid export membrane protein
MITRRKLGWLVLSGSVANLGLPLSSVITGPLLARTLNPDGRGLMAALVVPISLANFIFTMGLPESLTFHIAGQRISTRTARWIAVLGGLCAGLFGAAILVLAGPYLLARHARYLSSSPLFSPVGQRGRFLLTEK